MMYGASLLEIRVSVSIIGASTSIAVKLERNSLIGRLSAIGVEVVSWATSSSVQHIASKHSINRLILSIVLDVSMDKNIKKIRDYQNNPVKTVFL
mgnify:FL=1